MEDQIKSAFTSATEVVKNTLTLSAAMLTLSIAFVKDLKAKPTNLEVWFLESSWVLLFLSVVFGIATLMAITGSLAKKYHISGDELYKNNIRIPMVLHFICFIAGIAAMGTFGMLSI